MEAGACWLGGEAHPCLSWGPRASLDAELQTAGASYTSSLRILAVSCWQWAQLPRHMPGLRSKGRGVFSRFCCWVLTLGGAPQHPAWLSRPSAASKAKFWGGPRLAGCSLPWPCQWIPWVRKCFPALHRPVILAEWPGGAPAPWKMPLGTCLGPSRRFGG